MSETYNILNEKEMNETITIVECRNLRKMINTLTAAPIITKKEYVRFIVIINAILNRLEKEGTENADPAN